MASESITYNKSKIFALRIIDIYKFLTDKKREYVMSKQLLKCATSIGANLAESRCGISKKDFLAKVYISLKECSETLYWLELLGLSDYLSAEQYHSLNNDCLEIFKLLTATTKTLSRNLELDIKIKQEPKISALKKTDKELSFDNRKVNSSKLLTLNS